jgi:hypothetical protein
VLRACVDVVPLSSHNSTSTRTQQPLHHHDGENKRLHFDVSASAASLRFPVSLSRPHLTKHPLTTHTLRSRIRFPLHLASFIFSSVGFRVHITHFACLDARGFHSLVSRNSTTFARRSLFSTPSQDSHSSPRSASHPPQMLMQRCFCCESCVRKLLFSLFLTRCTACPCSPPSTPTRAGCNRGSGRCCPTQRRTGPRGSASCGDARTGCRGPCT